MATQYNLTIEQGITYSKTFTRTVLSDPSDKDSPRVPVDMTGMEARATIRSRDGKLIGAFICVVNGAAGQVVLGMPHTETALLNFDTAIFDVDLYRDGVPVKRFLRGTVTLCKDVLDD